jgi:hypothetical protein
MLITEPTGMPSPTSIPTETKELSWMFKPFLKLLVPWMPHLPPEENSLMPTHVLNQPLTQLVVWITTTVVPLILPLEITSVSKTEKTIPPLVTFLH